MYGAKKIILTIVTAVIMLGSGIFGYWYQSTADARRLKDTDSWITYPGNGYMIQTPDGLEPGCIYLLDQQFTLLDNRFSREIGYAVSVANLNSDQLRAMKSYTLMELMEMTHSKINGIELVPIQRGDMVYASYHKTAKNVFPDDDEVYIIDVLLIKDDKLYDLSLLCPNCKHKEYTDYLFKMMDSFRIK